LDVVVGQLAGLEREPGQGLPKAAVEMEEALQALDEEVADRALEVLGQLAAVVAVRPLQRRLAVGAGRARFDPRLPAPAEPAARGRRCGDVEFTRHLGPPRA